MPTTDSYAPFYAEFLNEYPDALAGVKMVTRLGGTAPVMAMNTATLTRFILWALGKGYVTRADLAPEMVGMVSRVQAEAARLRA